MALRGDPPGGPGTPWTPTEGGLTYANELVALIRERTDMRIGVAAFPEGHVEAADLDSDVRVLRAKYDAGAEFAVTDMVLRASDYVALVDRARAVGADLPIIPGIMPILNLRSMERMVELSRRQLPEEITGAPHAVRRRPGPAAGRGHRDRDRAVRDAARRRGAGPPLLHAQPVQGDARDLRQPADHRLTRMQTVTVTGTGVVPSCRTARWCGSRPWHGAAVSRRPTRRWLRPPPPSWRSRTATPRSAGSPPPASPCGRRATTRGARPATRRGTPTRSRARTWRPPGRCWAT